MRLLHIPHLPMADACYQMLERISIEFGPIIARRGYQVVSISELCCCGDGLPRHGAKSDNVWGYNQTLYLRRRGGGIGGNDSTTHEIHLRLRHPSHHATQLLPWEDIAGTMAHELSHCVHQDHSPAFYQLMEEILEEHASNLVENMGSWIYGKPPSNGQRNPTTGSTNTASFPITNNGKRLGGKGSGKSRLLENKPRLQSTVGTASNDALPSGTLPSSPESRREMMARAAERRRRQTEKVRRRIENSKESCVWRSAVDETNVYCLPVTQQQEENALPTTTTTPNAAVRQPEIIDLTSPETPNYGFGNTTWDCWKCTFRNQGSRSCCEMCYSQPKPHQTVLIFDDATDAVVSEIL